MNEADADRIRSVLGRFVGGDEDELCRITFENGAVFTLQYLAEWDEDDEPAEARDLVGAWDGSIVAVENLQESERRLFVPGSGIVFVGSEIVMIEDELTGEVLFSRAPGRS